MRDKILKETQKIEKKFQPLFIDEWKIIYEKEKSYILKILEFVNEMAKKICLNKFNSLQPTNNILELAEQACYFQPLFQKLIKKYETELLLKT